MDIFERHYENVPAAIRDLKAAGYVHLRGGIWQTWHSSAKLIEGPTKDDPCVAYLDRDHN